MTERELDALKNPGKTIPPEAIEGMRNMGEMMRRQQEANRAAGVDSRGIPLEKSTEQAPVPGSNDSGGTEKEGGTNRR